MKRERKVEATGEESPRQVPARTGTTTEEGSGGEAVHNPSQAGKAALPSPESNPTSLAPGHDAWDPCARNRRTTPHRPAATLARAVPCTEVLSARRQALSETDRRACMHAGSAYILTRQTERKSLTPLWPPLFAHNSGVAFVKQMECSAVGVVQQNAHMRSPPSPVSPLCSTPRHSVQPWPCLGCRTGLRPGGCMTHPCPRQHVHRTCCPPVTRTHPRESCRCRTQVCAGFRTMEDLPPSPPPCRSKSRLPRHGPALLGLFSSKLQHASWCEALQMSIRMGTSQELHGTKQTTVARKRCAGVEVSRTTKHTPPSSRDVMRGYRSATSWRSQPLGVTCRAVNVHGRLMYGFPASKRVI